MMSILCLIAFLFGGIHLVRGGLANYNSNCPDISNSLDDGCSINDDCTKITCTLNAEGGKVLSWTIKINKCEDPVTIDVTIDSGFIHWSKTFTSNERVGVPGLSINIPLFGKAGVFVRVSLPDSGSNLNLKVEMLFGIETGGGSFKQVGKSVTVVNSKLPINTFECGFVRFWNNLELPFKILLVVGVISVLIGMFCCCYCCCCRKPKTPGTIVFQPPPPAATVISSNNTTVPMKPFVDEI